ncbi:MAG: UDP-N-acetylmuramate--L-alanine ligase [Candidatus Daviesbacteria bacterium]|nr:UDP-N-acetylmuramate--L-alanine ligase [Candidatus Daviesbacteria bacterium]
MAKKVHFLGIGGSGASGAAAIAEAQGFEVTGCDLQPNNEFTTIFKPDQLLTGHNPDHLFYHAGSTFYHPVSSSVTLSETKGITPDIYSSATPQNDRRDTRNDKSLASHIGSGNVDILAVTPAIFSLDLNNPELLTAKEKGVPAMTWQQFLGQYLAKEKFVIAVCGTHGKTTTTAMIARLLENAGLDPTVLLGAIIPKWKTNYRIGRSKFLVVEADEFNDNFLPTKPDIAVVTNIEMDHPEYFKDFEAVKESFKKFLLQTKQTVVANLTDPGAAEVVKVVMKTPVKPGTPLQYLDYSRNELEINLQIPGEFNRLNAKAAMSVGLLLGIEPEIIKKSLADFTGASKRFEYIGEYKGAKVYSDFGHHPTEIEKTMEAVREKFPKERILLVYQPHMFSRTKALFNDFVKVFQNITADKTYILDIYPSREVDTGLVTSEQLVETVNKSSVSYLGTVPDALEKIKPEIKARDIVFFMSAGDTDKLAKELVSS